jgi:hypothetical protein
METFKAKTQHDDWMGTVSADISDVSAIAKYLKKKGMVDKSGSLVAISVDLGEKIGRIPQSVNVRAFFHDGQDFDSIKIAIANTEGQFPVREVKIGMTLEEFFGLFESFNLMLTWPDIGLENREFKVIS